MLKRQHSYHYTKKNVSMKKNEIEAEHKHNNIQYAAYTNNVDQKRSYRCLVAEINLKLIRCCSTPVTDAFVPKYLESLQIQPLVTKIKYINLHMLITQYLVHQTCQVAVGYVMPMQKIVGLYGLIITG
jgi:hypothetical protein